MLKLITSHEHFDQAQLDAWRKGHRDAIIRLAGSDHLRGVLRLKSLSRSADGPVFRRVLRRELQPQVPWVLWVVQVADQRKVRQRQRISKGTRQAFSRGATRRSPQAFHARQNAEDTGSRFTWNCRVGGFRYKASRIAPFGPDVLAVQEVEPLTLEKFPDGCRPTYCDRSWAVGFPRRGFGMFSYSPRATFHAVDGEEPFSGFRRYEVTRDRLSFNVGGVWPWATRTAKTSVGSGAQHEVIAC